MLAKTILMMDGVTYAKFREEYDGKIIGTPEEIAARSVNWQEEVTRPSLNQNYRISVSGQTKAKNSTNYFIALGHANTQGIVIGTGLENSDARLNLVQNLGSKFRITSQTSASFIKNNWMEGTEPGGSIYADTYIMLEQVGHRLDREVERVFNLAEAEGLTGMGITHYIEEYIDLANVLRTSSREWDGGYVICGLTGSGESFAIRDPWGIRPAFWYQDDEIAVLASERPVIQTALNVPFEEIKELQPGQALLISKEGKIRTSQINKPRENHACSFERIYFSRGSDVDIYKERKRLGEKLVPRILKAINNDIDHTVFSFIPNTAEVAFYGMLQGLDDYLNEEKVQQIAALGHHPDMEELEVILSRRIRSEKVAIKDIKLRTFIAEGNSRNDLAAHVYDITYGSLVPGVDNLVIIDDSIVRGTTLKQSIIGILDRLGPKKIVIVSSSPQVRYPDYYGIDMAKMSEFIAFRAAVELLKERDMKDVIAAAYRKSKDQVGLPKEQMINYVKNIYAPFTDEEISAKMVELLTPKGTKAKVEIVYQPLEGLHEACPHHKGDWYFSGNYPTPGGVKMVNRAFIDYIEQMYQF